MAEQSCDRGQTGPASLMEKLLSLVVTNFCLSHLSPYPTYLSYSIWPSGPLIGNGACSIPAGAGALNNNQAGEHVFTRKMIDAPRTQRSSR